MLLNRVQAVSPLFQSTQFGFATKSLKLIKIRMKAVESIKKITKANKMVAASKMRQDVDRLEKAKFFGVGSIDKIIASETYLHKKKTPVVVKKTLLVPLTSDKGLCGATNSNIVREVKHIVKGDRSAYKIFVVGDKGSIALSRPFPDILEHAITNITTPLNFPTAAAIASHILQHARDCEKILIVYNEFKNVVSQILRRAEVMNKPEFLNTFKYVVRHDPEDSEIAPTSEFFYEFYLATKLYNALLNNIASEQSSRMNAMENASKNAGEILDNLTLEYNKARQAKITMELCEIISGAAAV
jgi:F-type H+-transporting ATPase subunit gamma